MKRSDNIADIINSCDFDTFTEEIDILFGDRFGASNIVESHITSNRTRYSESFSAPLMIENTAEVSEANEHFYPLNNKCSADKILQ